jgi:putative transposase
LLEEKRLFIEPGCEITIARQCELLEVNRASFYYRARPESEENLRLMRLIDEQYLRTPFYGVQRMAATLSKPDAPVNPKRVRRLMRLMGLEAIYPKPRLSQANPQHKVYPYLLKGMCINRPDQVWSTDITYIRMARGFIYLVAVMDWFSRYVLSWSVSISLDVAFCCEALELALKRAKPEIFNTDQGSQFTSLDFTGILKREGIEISMDGRGRVFDNIFIERLWRSVKYEEVFLKDYQSVRDAIAGLRAYFSFYNDERPHQALDYRTPQQLYFAYSKEPALELSF